jgi:hypothetical protein
MDIRGIAERSILFDRQHSEAAAAVIGHENKLAQRIDAEVSGAGPRELTTLSSVKSPVARLIASAVTDPLVVPLKLPISFTA